MNRPLLSLDNDVISCCKDDHQALFSNTNWNHFRAGREIPYATQYYPKFHTSQTLCYSLDKYELCQSSNELKV